MGEWDVGAVVGGDQGLSGIDKEPSPGIGLIFPGQIIIPLDLQRVKTVGRVLGCATGFEGERVHPNTIVGDGRRCNLFLIVLRQLLTHFLKTIRANAVGEIGTGMAMDVAFDLVPVIAVVPHPFAIHADRQQFF